MKSLGPENRYMVIEQIFIFFHGILDSWIIIIFIKPYTIGFSLESSQGCIQILLKLKFSGSIGEILGNLLATFNIAWKFLEF